MKIPILSIAFWLLVSNLTNAQRTISGIVINGKTKESLPFVNVIVKGKYKGTTSDLDGRFKIDVESSATLVFTYVGYEKHEIAVAAMRDHQIISLREKSTELKEIVIRPEDNPAWKIIRKAIENKPVNDPENLNSFTYNSYNRLYATFSEADSVVHYSRKVRDTASLRKFLERNHLFIIESTSKRFYKKPYYTKEVVTGNRMTGVKDPFFSFLATDFQPFSFYKDFILLFDKSYLNPLSNGFENRYDFTLEDSVQHERDTTFIISFEPLPGKTFEGLKGQLHISSDGYAIEHVIAEPSDDKALIKPKIQQEYSRKNGRWFPMQLHSELLFADYKIMGRRLKYISRSYFSQIEVNPEIDQKIFDRVQVQFDKKANHQTEEYWKLNRLDSLGKKEKNTFKLYDSISSKTNIINSSFKIFEALMISKFDVGIFYIPLENLIKVNTYENVRFGLGFQTKETFSKTFVLSGYGGYGIRDSALKYGSSLQINFQDRKQTSLSVSYRQDLDEPGSGKFIKNPVPGSESYRSWITSRMDSVVEWKAKITTHPFPFATTELFFNTEKRNPAYSYSYTGLEDPATSRWLDLSTAGLYFRYAYKENYTQLRNTLIVTNKAYPQVNLSLIQGYDNLLNGRYRFTRTEFRFNHEFQVKGLGKTIYEIGAGIVDGHAPYSYLFNGKGLNASGSLGQSFIVNNYFQTMGLYEFVSDRYLNIFINHHIGRLTGTGSKYFRPELSIASAMGYGTLRSADEHKGLDFKTMNKGFYESGLIVSNFIRFKYLNLFYYGLGGGVFYRYGAYAKEKTSDNLVYKIVVSFNF